jgi:hypothetical protein
MRKVIRPVLLAVAFAATAAAITGLAFRAETKEAGLVENTCAKAAWPLIPAKCLDGGRRDVRVITDLTAEEPVPGSITMARFNAAFQ